jgi:hypothetical protein
MGRTEDIHLGARASVQVGWAEPAFGSDQRAMILTSSASYGAQPQTLDTVLANGSFNGRVENGTLRDSLAEARARWYHEQSHHWPCYALIDGAVGHNLDLDDQLLLGGDNGLRGYPLRYQDGTFRLLMTVEERYFSDVYLFKTLRLGGAVFADTGRVWGQAPLAV